MIVEEIRDCLLRILRNWKCLENNYKAIMENNSTWIHQNRIISAILALWIVSFIYFFLTNESFLLRAFERHQNILSWYIRPALVIPFCYFAYKRSINGILFVVLSIFTSMFWFPTPEVVSEQVSNFLAWEREYLLGKLTLGKSLFFGVVIAYFILLWKAFWNRSYRLWIAIVILAWLGKGFWSVRMSPETWAVAMPIAIAWIWGFLLTLFIYTKFFNK